MKKDDEGLITIHIKKQFEKTSTENRENAKSKNEKKIRLMFYLSISSIHT